MTTLPTPGDVIAAGPTPDDPTVYVGEVMEVWTDRLVCRFPTLPGVMRWIPLDDTLVYHDGAVRA